MLSIGIRFGEGFDKKTLKELIDKGKMPFEYDFVVIGANAGGLACAREAQFAGKKVAIINWRRRTPAEEESSIDDLTLFELIGDFSDLRKIGQGSKGSRSDWKSEVDPALRSKMQEDELKKLMGSGADVTGSQKDKSKRDSFTYSIVSGESGYSTYGSSMFTSGSSFDKSPTEGTQSPSSMTKKKKWSRKLKKSKLDLKHAIHNLGRMGRKMMHCAALLKEQVADARNTGWRVPVIEPTINWSKMSEGVLDYIMLENWRLKNELHDRRIEYIDGPCTFLDDHRIKIDLSNGGEREISAEVICAAVEAFHKVPEDIPGARQFGITSDDLIRLEDEPGKTLVVGGGEVGMECAGIICGFDFEVKIIEEERVMQGFDSEMVKLIVDDLRSRGVVIMENTKIVSIEHSEETNNLHVKYLTMVPKSMSGEYEDEGEEEEEEMEECEIEEEFDTVLFAIGTNVKTEELNIRAAGVTPVPITEKIYAPEEKTEVDHIYAVGDVLHERPENYAVAELAGELLGKRIFAEDQTLMDYDLVPMAIFTPTEYSFIGLSEETAFIRFGSCIDVYKGYYQPLEYVLPERKKKCTLKVLVLTMNDWVIGIHMWGPDSSEIIQGFASAVKCGLTNKKLRTTVGVHTSKAEKLTKLRRYTKESEGILSRSKIGGSK